MQSEGKKAPRQSKKYPNAIKAYGIIRREEGLLGLWKGLGPNIARNAIINAAELASYDQIKVRDSVITSCCCCQLLHPAPCSIVVLFCCAVLHCCVTPTLIIRHASGCCC
jgi:solute carrier family 25 uncoupling protein 8/9